MRLALDGYRGEFKDIPVTGAFLDSMSRERHSDTGVYCVSMRVTVFYQEIQRWFEQSRPMVCALS